MMPTEDALGIGEELGRRFGLPLWQGELMYYTHLFLTNRGLLITPFHNMMLIPPVATEADIDLLIKGWDDCLGTVTLIGNLQAK